MTVAAVATASLLTLLVAALLLGALIVAGRSLRRAREARRSRLAAPARRLLLAITAGDDEPEQLDALATLPPATWRAIEPTAVAMLGKIRGEAHAALVAVFERRGSGARAMNELSARDPVRRARAAEVLGNLEHAGAVDPLCRLLGDRDPDVRAVAARALGRVGDPGATAPLLAALTGRRAVPPHFVAHAIIRLGVGAQPMLAAALDDPDPLVRATAAEVLGLVGAVTAANRLVDAVRTDTSPEVRERAATALGRLGTRSALPPLLEAVGPDRPPALRAAAAGALGDLGAVAAAAPLADLLADSQHLVAHRASRSLLLLGPKGRAALERAAAARHDATLAGAHAREALAMAALDEARRTPVAPPSTGTGAAAGGPAAGAGHGPATDTGRTPADAQSGPVLATSGGR